MKEITILSGKGGTGKTSITAAIASIAENAVFCDNDVDASDLHLLLQPTIRESHTFASGWDVEINQSLCVSCYSCMDYCQFDAIHKNDKGDVFINPYQCEGCLLCQKICPEDAISSSKNENNFWYKSDSRFGPLIHAQMGPGEENSGKLVTQVRRIAKETATANQLKYIINDGPPGIGCATIASLSGTNKALLIIEPTKSGFHDIKRLVKLIESFNVKTYAAINKYDINAEITANIEAYLIEKNIPLLAYIPFDDEMVKAMTQGKTIVEYNPGSVITKIINEIWKILQQ